MRQNVDCNKTSKFSFPPALVRVGVSAGVAGKMAASRRVKMQELADSTFTIPASVLARDALKKIVV
jgi:hypothetical protein